MKTSKLSPLDSPVDCALDELLQAWRFVGNGAYHPHFDAEQLIAALPDSLRRLSQHASEADEPAYLQAACGIAVAIRTALERGDSPQFDAAVRTSLIGSNLSLASNVLRELLELLPQRLATAQAELRSLVERDTADSVSGKRISLSGLALVGLCAVAPEWRLHAEYCELRRKTIDTLETWMQDYPTGSAERFLEYLGVIHAKS